jgi:hypothetical protein
MSTGGSTLPYGPGSKLWDYWMHGKGSTWRAAKHPFTTLYRLLRKAIPKSAMTDDQVRGLTMNMLQAAGLR